jgi:hypothetical protein
MLPALPFMFILASQVFMTPRRVSRRIESGTTCVGTLRTVKCFIEGVFRALCCNWLTEKWIKRIGYAALAWSVVSSMSVYPHSLSYFNEFAGGPKNGHAHLLASNIDYGQDILFLKTWLDEHPEARPLHMGVWTRFDPRVAGIEFTLPPECPPPDKRDATMLQEYGPLPGWYALSVNYLRGYQARAPDGKGSYKTMTMYYYTYFQQFEPVGMAGYSIYIYHITPQEANRVRKQLGLPPVGELGGDAT